MPPVRAKAGSKHWIPAFAGMAEVATPRLAQIFGSTSSRTIQFPSQF